MTCEYRFNGGDPMTYQALIDSLSGADIDTALSILFSLSKQDAVYDSIMQLKKEHQFKTWEKKTFNSIDGEPSIDVGSDMMSIQQFIDSHYFMINGEPPMFKMVFDDYLKYKKEDLVENKKMSESDAEDYVNLMKDRWEIIAQDAFDLHKLLVSTKGKTDDLTYQELSMSATGTAFQSIVDKVEAASSKVIKQVFLRNGADKTGGGAKGRLIKNVNLSAELKGIPEEIVGHIDYLIIRDNGDIEVFNIKSSTESYTNWDSAKKEKYRYQMAILKRILEFNGIPAKNIRMNIIPVKMTYDPTFQYVTDLEVEQTVAVDFKDSTYILKKYDQAAEQFIASKVVLEDIDTAAALKLHGQLQKIFPGRDIEAYGIKETAKTWVARYWNQLKPTPVDGGGWEITLPGEKKPIKIDDARVGSKNEEIVGIVQDRLEDLSRNVQNEKGIYRVITDIKNAYERSGFYNPSGEYGHYLGEQFAKYFEGGTKVDDDGKLDYSWELINNDILTEAGILVFRNKYTQQLDVVTLTNFDVTQEYKFKGRNNLLGYYLPDINSENFTMKSDYGNIEAIRTMTVLNEVLPHIEGTIKLGELKVLGISHQMHGKKGRLFDFSRLVPQYDTIVKVVNKNTEAKIDNNFKIKGFKYVDQADILIQQWNEIISSNPNLTEIKSLDEYISQKHLIDGTTIDGLVQVGTIEAKVEKLELLIDKLRDLAKERGIKVGDTRKLLDISKSARNDLNKAIAILYIAATKALNQYYGDLSLENEDFGAIQEYMLKNNSINNSNVRQVGFMFQKAIDKIASDMVNRYSPIRPIFMEFYEKAGYTKAQNAVIGNQASVYRNLYELDENGNRTMQFKNPYDEFNDLKDYERDFLKKILFEFHKIRCEMLGKTNDIKGPDDPKLQQRDKIPTNYFNAPLERASAATRRTQMDKGFTQWGKKMVRMITKPGEFFEEMQGLVGSDEMNQRRDDINNLQAYNPFLNSERNTNVRNSYLSEKGVDYFEYNVENLLIDFMEKHVQSEEFNKMLTRAKGIELDLILRGETESDTEGIERTLKTINDFLNINVFNKSIIGEDAQRIEAIMAPIRSAVSTLYVAGNIAGAVRDGFQGLLENISSAIIKFQTDIGVSDVAFGYKEVISEGVGNLMTMTKLNQFNVKYRFSNLDVARISEGQKTGRGGILNGEQWAYATLRGPDYLNRMVLFVAKMNHDGCYDAYTLDDEKRLVYDWRKDKRFNLFAKGEDGKRENEAEYNKQKSLYYSLIRAFNLEGYRKENGDQLNYSDDLPDAYTLQEIQTFKTFSDNIYGSYNKSTKAKYEHTALGRNFAFFSTWMNGIVDVYMKDTQVSQGESKLQQETDYNGNLLFFAENGDITTEDTGVPVMKGVPIMVQGVFATLRDICKTFYHCGMDEQGNWNASRGWNAIKTDIWTNEVARRNMRRLLRDILIGGLLTALFKLWLDEVYREHKANDDGRNVATNAAIEILYKSSSSCFDTFLGPMAIYDYLGNQTNPATYRLQSKVFNDIWNFALGEKTMGQIMMSSQALPRTFQDTYNMWVRDTKTTTEE